MEYHRTVSHVFHIQEQCESVVGSQALPVVKPRAQRNRQWSCAHQQFIYKAINNQPISGEPLGAERTNDNVEGTKLGRSSAAIGALWYHLQSLTLLCADWLGPRRRKTAVRKQRGAGPGGLNREVCRAQLFPIQSCDGVCKYWEREEKKEKRRRRGHWRTRTKDSSPAAAAAVQHRRLFVRIAGGSVLFLPAGALSYLTEKIIIIIIKCS